MAKTPEQHMAEALAEMKMATWKPERWCAAIQDGYPPGHEYNWMATHNYKAQVAMWNAAHPAPTPPPQPAPPQGSVFSGKGAFTTSEPAALNGLNLDWVALQADPEGSLSGYTGSAKTCWWQARADHATVDLAKAHGIPYIGQAENQAELDKCLALNTDGLVAKALVGNAGSWTSEGAEKALAQGWDYISEWYMNAHPWEHEPTGHNYPRFVNVCFGIYSEGEPGGQGYVAQIPLSDYLAVWHGSYSVWKAEALTPADRALING